MTVTVSWSLTPFLKKTCPSKCFADFRHNFAIVPMVPTTMASLWQKGSGVVASHLVKSGASIGANIQVLSLSGKVTLTWKERGPQKFYNISIHIYICKNMCVLLWILHKTHLHNLHTDIWYMFSFNHMVQFQSSFVSPEHLFHQGLAKIQLLATRPGASCRIWPLDHKRNDQDLARVPGLPKSGKPITVSGHGKHILWRIKTCGGTLNLKQKEKSRRQEKAWFHWNQPS